MRDSFRSLVGACIVAAGGALAGAACAFIDAVQGDTDTEVTCASGTDDCNFDASDGCEVNLNTDILHCGMCENECALAHANPACVDGECEIDTCQNGWTDGNNTDSDGCELFVGS